MEEDNAHDIFKWFSTLGSAQQQVSVDFRDETYNAELTLRGNLLTCVSTIDAKVPLLFVIEGATVRKYETKDSSFACLVSFPDPADNLILHFDSEKDRECWMVKIATCSHQMVRAQLDETAYKFYTMGTKQDGDAEESKSINSFYLTNPHTVNHNFALSQQNYLPARRVSFSETMSESKLSIVLPLELVKLYKKWITEFAALLESRQRRWPSFAINGLHDVLREVRENSETLEQCAEFLQNYSGPPFRKSMEKHRVAFAPVPTNLHVHSSVVDQRASQSVISCGTASCLPLRFQSGGLTRLLTILEISQSYHDFNFFSNRQTAVDLKKYIGQLNHRLEVEWTGDVEARGLLCSDISAGIKDTYERLKELVENVADVENYADILMEDEKRRLFLGQNVEKDVPDGLQNQLDTIDAMLVSLSTKVAVMDRIEDEQSKSEVYEKSVQDAICACLDALLILADSFLEAQLFGLVTELHKNSMAHLYFHIQIRTDFVLSQAITIAATAVVDAVYRGWPVFDGFAGDLLLTVFSFLSAYGDEKGMAEDAWEAWRQLESRVTFSLVRAPSQVCRTCVPLLSGARTQISVSIPLPHSIYDSLPASLKSRKSISVRCAYFNVGVNHEATLGQSFGGVALETSINQEGAERLLSYSNRYTVEQTARDAVMELVNAVASEPSRKNLAIYEWAMASCESLKGQAVICCKSGKDRTGMAVTIEQGRLLRETCGLNAAQLQEVIASLRRDGARRENCRKNVGKAMYSFSPFQMHFLPKAFRPPSGTYAQGVAS